MSRNITKHQLKQERLAEKLVVNATGIEREDVNFATALQFVVSNLQYHRYLEASRPAVERSVDGLCKKFEIHVQQRKSERLRELVDEFLSRDLKDDLPDSERHYSILSFLLNLSETPLQTDCVEKEWRIPAVESTELSAAEWHKILHGDDDITISYSSGSDLEPWSSDDEEYRDQKPLRATQTVGASTGDTAIAAARGEPQPPAVGAPGARHFPAPSGQGAHDDDGRRQRKAFLQSRLTQRYWQSAEHCWPVTRVDPGKWQGCDGILAAMCSTVQRDHFVLQSPSPHHEVTEEQIVRETIWCLCGSTNLFIYNVDDREVVTARPNIQVRHFSESSLRNSLHSFATLASRLMAVRRFLSDTLGAAMLARYGNKDSASSGSRCSRTKQAFASALNAYVSILTRQLCELEAQNSETDTCKTLLQLRLQLTSIQRKVNLLHQLVVNGVLDTADNRKAVCHLIRYLESTVSDLALSGEERHELRDITVAVLLATLRPYMAMLEQWMAYGSLMDPYKEFGIVRNPNVGNDSSALELSADWWNHAVTLWSPSDEDGVDTPDTAAVAAASEEETPVSDLLPEMFKTSLPQGLKAGKSLCLLRTLEKMSTGRESPVTSEQGQCRFKASLFQDFLHDLQQRLLGGNPSSDGGDAAASVGSGPSEDALDEDEDTDAASQSSLSVGSVTNFDIDAEFHISNAAAATDGGFDAMRPVAESPSLGLESVDACAAAVGDGKRSVAARHDQLHWQSSSVDVGAGDEPPPGIAECRKFRSGADSSCAAGHFRTATISSRLDDCAPPLSAAARPRGYLSAMAPSLLLARNFQSLTAGLQEHRHFQSQMQSLQTTQQPGGVLESPSTAAASIATTSLSTIPIVHRGVQSAGSTGMALMSQHPSAKGCVVRDDTASQDDNDTISSLSSRLSVMCNAGSSASLGGGGDVIPGGDNVVISGSHRSACHGGPVGGHPSSLVGEQALRLFADDLSAVSHLVKTLPACHVPMSVALKHSLPPLLHRRSDAICLQLANVLRDRYHLCQHMKHLQSYFLMEAGSVMHHFGVGIFEQIRRGEDWLHSSSLNALLQESLSYGEDFDNVSGLLMIDIVRPAKAKSGAGRTRHLPSARHLLTETVMGFDTLALHYRTEWPVDIVIDDSLLEGLNSIFRFLLHLKYAKWSLDNCFWRDTTFSSRSGCSRVYRLAFLLRLKLQHVVNAMHTYIMTRILHSIGKEFLENLQQAKDVDELISCFRSYVRWILDRCLLNKEASFVREAVLKLLRQAVLFRQVCDSGLQNASLEKVTAMMEECDRCHMFLVNIFNGIIRRGVFPHLEALALSLAWRS